MWQVVTFESHDFAAEQVTTATGAIGLGVAEQPLGLDLTQFATPTT